MAVLFLAVSVFTSAGPGLIYAHEQDSSPKIDSAERDGKTTDRLAFEGEEDLAAKPDADKVCSPFSFSDVNEWSALFVDANPLTHQEEYCIVIIEAALVCRTPPQNLASEAARYQDFRRAMTRSSCPSARSVCQKENATISVP